MAHGPVIIFDKSTIQTLTIDESVLLDNFYMSNIVPVFFAECLADLERDMKKNKSKGSPESLVRSLAARTPDSQACGNVFHRRILEGELAGYFDFGKVRFRPLRDRGKPVKTGDSRGLLFQASEEEEAVRRWEACEFLELERQSAKQWRRAIEYIDLKAMADALLSVLSPERMPTSLADAKEITDTLIDRTDREHLIRVGLLTMGLAEATDFTVARWKGDRYQPLQAYLPYFVHVLSITIFFALALSASLLRFVKPSHAIDLAYLYYLPFCTVFSSRDNFHVQVAPLFMDPFQTFVHGDDLKKDLAKLHERYQQLPLEEQEKGLIGFADYPPTDDSSCLTAQLWDKYLPKWREPREAFTDLPPDMIEALNQLSTKFTGATATEAHDEHDVDKLDFVTVTKKVSLKRGSYLLYSKDTLEKIAESETQQAAERQEVSPVVHKPGTAFSLLSQKLAEVSRDSKCSSLELYFLCGKYDDAGEKIVEDGMWKAEVRSLAINSFDESSEAILKREYHHTGALSALALWTRYGLGTLGILRFKPVQESAIPARDEHDDWERTVIAAYLRRHKF